MTAMNSAIYLRCSVITSSYFLIGKTRYPRSPTKTPKFCGIDGNETSLTDRSRLRTVPSDIFAADGPSSLTAKRLHHFRWQLIQLRPSFTRLLWLTAQIRACKQASEKNIYGSLAITYVETDGGTTQPFHVEIDKRNPLHILDSHNLPIVLGELDTVSDFSTYLDEKVRAVKKFDNLMYCGEEDLLGHFLLNYDKVSKRHVIGPKGDNSFNCVMIGEGEWHDFIQTDIYQNTKKENQISYFWDRLIQTTCENALNGTLGGNSDLKRGKSAIFEMVKEPRFVRRSLADKMLNAVNRFPDHPSQFTRQVTLLPSFEPNVAYVLLQLRVPDKLRGLPDHREKRLALLEIACGAAKNKFPKLIKVIGIGIDAPKFSGGTVAEDFILMPCEVWPDEMRAHYENENKEWNFFGTAQLQQFEERVTQFVPPASVPPLAASTAKVGRNDPCPCGSGKKFKKCHGHEGIS